MKKQLKDISASSPNSLLLVKEKDDKGNKDKVVFKSWSQMIEESIVW